MLEDIKTLIHIFFFLIWRSFLFEKQPENQQQTFGHFYATQNRGTFNLWSLRFSTDGLWDRYPVHRGDGHRNDEDSRGNCAIHYQEHPSCGFNCPLIKMRNEVFWALKQACKTSALINKWKCDLPSQEGITGQTSMDHICHRPPDMEEETNETLWLHLECRVQFWVPQFTRDLVRSNQVQWWSTRIFSGLETVMCKERLRVGFVQSGERETLLPSTLPNERV